MDETIPAKEAIFPSRILNWTSRNTIEAKKMYSGKDNQESFLPALFLLAICLATVAVVIFYRA
jgi:hypothetical protein